MNLDQFWEVPEEECYKINVFYVSSPVPLPNGNTNGVGAIARDSSGSDVWGAMGPTPTLNEEQALMVGIQAACVEAEKKKWGHIQIETSNPDIYDTIRMQEHLVLRDDQLEVYSLFNTVHANHFITNKTIRHISWVPQRMNGTAEYLATYGMNNLTEFSEFTGSFGELNYYLARDMGLVLPSPIREAASFLGDGEVIDAAPPRTCPQKEVGCSLPCRFDFLC